LFFVLFNLFVLFRFYVLSNLVLNLRVAQLFNLFYLFTLLINLVFIDNDLFPKLFLFQFVK